jgi:hypothetical protein
MPKLTKDYLLTEEMPMMIKNLESMYSEIANFGFTKNGSNKNPTFYMMVDIKQKNSDLLNILKSDVNYYISRFANLKVTIK